MDYLQIINPGDVFQNVKDPSRRVKVKSVAKPNPIWAGRRDASKFYATCESIVAGKRRTTSIKVDELLSGRWIIIEAPAAIKSGQDAAAGC
jgi:hypothetical protein